MKNDAEAFDVGLAAVVLIVLAVVAVLVIVIRAQRTGAVIESRVPRAPGKAEAGTPRGALLVAAVAVGGLLLADFWRMVPVIGTALAVGALAGVALSAAPAGGERLRAGAVAALLAGSVAGTGWFLMLSV